MRSPTVRSPVATAPVTDHYTLSATLTASANHRKTVLGAQLHVHAIKAGLKSYPHAANTLLSLYAKSEDFVSMKRIFCEIENLDVFCNVECNNHGLFRKWNWPSSICSAGLPDRPG
ncbi:hypothetical protein U1Q18_041420 [Sarracenia purpurea var. burkii]